MDESVLVLLALLALASLVGTPIGLLLLMVRVHHLGELARRVERLERQLAGSRDAAPTTAVSTVEVADEAAVRPPAASELIAAELVAAEVVGKPADTSRTAPISKSKRTQAAASAFESITTAEGWEQLLGRRALGWAAVLTLVFGTAFFIRYAIQNDWIGPLGRVALGMVAGMGLVAAGWRYHRRRWHIFSQMLTSAGIVLLYLSTFSAFGFYHLIGQREAAVFLLLVVAEGALLALLYDAPVVAFVSLIGGLITPPLMQSDHDQYVELFIYLVVLDAGTIALLLRRSWPGLGLVALLGTHALFWSWYEGNYHPEKLTATLALHAAVFALFFGHSLLTTLLATRRTTWEEVVRLSANGLLTFLAAFVLLREDYRPWLGSLAVTLAAIYTLLARITLPRTSSDRVLALASVAVASGFVAMAIPLEARAEWIALGWAAQAAVMWWFGARLALRPMRMMAAALAVLAIGRVLAFDAAQRDGAPYVLLLNDYAIPALAVAACSGIGLWASRRAMTRLPDGEWAGVGLAVVCVVLLPWWIITVDLWEFFEAWGRDLSDRQTYFRVGQMALSGWWALYGVGLLAAGFRGQLALFRWTALGVFALTVTKVFFFDIAGLDAIYRIITFFVVAVLLGAATWAYQWALPSGPRRIASAADLTAEERP